MNTPTDQAWRWYRRDAGDFAELGDLLTSAVVIAPTNSPGEPIRPLSIGANSLPARVLGSTDVSALSTSLRYQPAYARQVAEGFRHMLTYMEPLEDVHECVGVTTAGEIDLRIRKLALPIRTTTGGVLIFSFSEIITIQ